MFGKLINKLFGSNDHKDAKEIASPLADMLHEAEDTSKKLDSSITEMKAKVTELEGKLVEINKLADWLKTGVPSIGKTTE